MRLYLHSLDFLTRRLRKVFFVTRPVCSPSGGVSAPLHTVTTESFVPVPGGAPSPKPPTPHSPYSDPEGLDAPLSSLLPVARPAASTTGASAAPAVLATTSGCDVAVSGFSYREGEKIRPQKKIKGGNQALQLVRQVVGYTL